MRLPFAPRERAGLIACTLLVALAVAVRLIYGPNIRDDAYITLRYAANLASGYGFVYNPGEAVLGTSTPLYTLFLAGLKAAGLDPIGAAVALGVMSDAAAIVLVFLLVWREDRWVPALVAGLGYALWLPLVSYAVSGMETPLYTALILATVLAYVRGRLNTVGAFAGLAAFLRPDGAILDPRHGRQIGVHVGGFGLSAPDDLGLDLLVRARVLALPLLIGSGGERRELAVVLLAVLRREGIPDLLDARCLVSQELEEVRRAHSPPNCLRNASNFASASAVVSRAGSAGKVVAAVGSASLV